ncbi:MAG: M48 family metalloprotease [Vicinamibacterales bacterium]
MNEDKASRYHRLARRARVAAAVWSTALLAALVATPLSVFMRDVAVQYANAAPAPAAITQSLVVVFYVMMLVALHECGALPLAYYRGHVLESRYDLSRQSAGRWWRTYIKEAALGLGFLQVGAVCLYALIGWWPNTWWIAATIAWSVAMVCLARLGPVLLFPLFYEVKPIQREELHEDLIRLTRKAGTQAMGVYGWTLSDSTRKANAALVGLGRTRRILLSDTLLSDYSNDEIAVVLAHELGHHVHGDIWRGLGLDAVVRFVSFHAAHRAVLGIGPIASVMHAGDIAGLPLILLVCGMLSMIAQPLANARSRAQERRADRFALNLTDNSPAFVSAMRRLAQQNLAEEHPSRWVQTLFHTHPSTAERLAIARNTPSISPSPALINSTLADIEGRR